MKYRRLGNTGLLVSELSLGGMTFGGAGSSPIGQLGQEEVKRLMKHALDEGVNLIDTANVYSNGKSESLIGKALKDLGTERESVVIATKVFGAMGEGPNDSGLSRKHILAQVDYSLDRLNTDYIDLYQIHGSDPSTPIEETLDVLDNLVQGGKVRYIGCSNLHAWQMVKAKCISRERGLVEFESDQAFYSLAGRELEREIVPCLLDQNMGLLVWSPLAGGLMSGKYRPGKESPAGARRTSFDFPPVDKEKAFAILEVVDEVARAQDASVPEVAIAWLLSKAYVTSVILGAKRLEQLTETLKCSALALTNDDLKRLDEASALKPEYPDWMSRDERYDRRAFLKGQRPSRRW